MIKKIISGGQTGADLAALDTAIKLRIPHGGWIPKDRITEEGPLPDKYQLVITLFYLQEFSYQEIAQVLDLPLGTVKTHLYRARERLKQQLQASEETVTTGACYAL